MMDMTGIGRVLFVGGLKREIFLCLYRIYKYLYTIISRQSESRVGCGSKMDFFEISIDPIVH
jgi:hypothetical protein